MNPEHPAATYAADVYAGLCARPQGRHEVRQDAGITLRNALARLITERLNNPGTGYSDENGIVLRFGATGLVADAYEAAVTALAEAAQEAHADGAPDRARTYADAAAYLNVLDAPVAVKIWVRQADVRMALDTWNSPSRKYFTLCQFDADGNQVPTAD